jgi:hypothetical protein
MNIKNKRKERKMDDAEFRFLKQWASDVAWEIAICDKELFGYSVLKIQSVILESMSPAKGWNNGINKS